MNVPKAKTIAVLTLVSDDGTTLIVSTLGTKAAPNTSLKSYSIDWGDGGIPATISGTPPSQLSHVYTLEGSYDIKLKVTDSKNKSDEALLDNVFITRNPTNPPVPGPNITQVIPISGIVGSTVIVKGTGFGATQGSSTIRLNSVTCTVNSWSSVSITIVVPNTTSGTIVVTVNGVPSAGAQFQVTGAPAVPVINSLSVTSGPVGTPVTINGNNFGATQGASFVRFNGITAAINSWSNTVITTAVPVGATTGSVVVTVGGVDSNGVTFTVTSVESFNWYVSTTGSDSNTGTGPASGQAFATLNKAFSVVSAGQSIGMRGGIYNQSVQSPGIAGTSWANKIRIANYNGEVVTLRPSAGGIDYIIQLENNEAFLEFEGINLDASNGTTANKMGTCFINTDLGAHHIRFMNAECIGNRAVGDLSDSRVFFVVFGIPGSDGGCEVIGATIHGSGGNNSTYACYFHNSNNRIEGCTIYDVSHTGIQVFNGSGNPNNNVITRNIIREIINSFNTQRIGIQVIGNNTLITNNLIYRLNYDSAEADSVAISIQGTGNIICNNNSVKNVGHNMDLGSPATSTTIRNNIGYGNTLGNGITDFGSSGTINSNNSFSGADPLFIDYANNNYHITNHASPEYHTGFTVAQVVVDLDNVTRTVPYDRGCYVIP